MSLDTNIGNLVTTISTSVRALRLLVTGSSTGGLGTLTTTDKSSIIAAINEVKASSSGAPPDASLTVKGIVELATDLETTTGTDTARATTPSNVKAAIDARVVAATASVSGIVELATTGESQTGTDTVRAVTPAGLKAAIDDAKAAILNGAPGALDTLDELAAALGDDANFAATVTTSLSNKQPLDTDLTAIAALTSAANKIPYATGAGAWALADFTAAGRAVVGAADAAAQRVAIDVWSKAEVGAVTTDYAAAYTTALNV